jgi:hypothetical protein
MRALLLIATLLLMPGCLTHVAVKKDSRHNEIAWAPDFDTARELATKKDKPLLLVMVAGGIDEPC